MDKKSLLIKTLAKIMEGHAEDIKKILTEYPNAPGILKQDGSMVTSLDFALSALLEKICHQNFPHLNFYSEENFKDLIFPIMVVDPLDGTKEYIAGRAEWSISVAVFMTPHFEGEGWICNPMTEEVYHSENVKIFTSKTLYEGEVSRTEWEANLFASKKSEKFRLSPMGSIAYKLGRLSHGQTDFVVSLKPKNIWDIAGGTLLCQKAGYRFYSQGKEVTQVQEKYLPPLIWCHESIFSELSELYS